MENQKLQQRHDIPAAVEPATEPVVVAADVTFGESATTAAADTPSGETTEPTAVAVEVTFGESAATTPAEADTPTGETTEPATAAVEFTFEEPAAIPTCFLQTLTVCERLQNQLPDERYHPTEGSGSVQQENRRRQ